MYLIIEKMSTGIRAPLKPLCQWLAGMIGFMVLLQCLGFFAQRQWDFTVYYLAANAQAMGLNPYDNQRALHHVADQLNIGYAGLPFLYPPHILRLMVPLSWFSPFAAAYIWLIAKLAALEVAVFIILNLLRMRVSIANLCLLHIAIVFYKPIRLDLNAGNVAIFEMALIYLSYWLWRRGKVFQSSCLFAATASMKWIPFIFLLYPVHLRDYNYLKYSVLSCSVLAALLLLDYQLLGHYLAFYRSMYWAMMWDEQVQSFFNCSSMTVILRTFSDTYFAKPLYESPLLVSILVPMFPVAVFMLTGYVIHKKQSESSFQPTDSAVLSLILCAILLLPPRLAGYSLSLAFLPLICLIQSCVMNKSLTLFTAILVSLFLLQSTFPPEHIPHGINQFLIDKDFFGLLFIYGGLVYQNIACKNE